MHGIADNTTSRFPANTSDAIIQARSTGAHYHMREVETIVLALDCRNSRICERLDSRSVIILCSIFIYSQECLAQQRGFCLLAVSLSTNPIPTTTHNVQGTLHRNEGDTVQESAQKQEKKASIGQAALIPLIKRFLKIDVSNKLRRWVGTTPPPDGSWLRSVSAWDTCFRTHRKLSRKCREATIRFA